MNHWEYGDNSDGTGANNDICLIKFAENIPDSDPEKKVRLACLPKAKETHGAGCWVAGWGTTKSGGRTSNKLKSVGVNILDHEYWNGFI